MTTSFLGGIHGTSSSARPDPARPRRLYRLFQRAIGGDWLKFEATATDQNWRSYQTILDRSAGLFAEGRTAGVFVDDDPGAMAVMLSGMTQAYLAHTVVGLGPLDTSITETFTVERLHAFIDRAFVTAVS